MSKELTKPTTGADATKSAMTRTPDPTTAEVGKASVAQGRNTVPPRVDVFENPSEYLVIADVPGVKSDGLHIRFADGELILEASLKTELNLEGPQNGYFRRFSVPDEIDAENISAALKRGVLTLTLPKRAGVTPRRIAVQAA